MRKYIDAEKLIAEIERYNQEAAIARFDNAGENADYFQGKVDLCNNLTHIISSLQQEQPEVDLEEELNRYLRGEFQQTAGGNFNNYIQVARHFAKWGAEHLKNKQK